MCCRVNTVEMYCLYHSLNWTQVVQKIITHSKHRSSSSLNKKNVNTRSIRYRSWLIELTWPVKQILPIELPGVLMRWSSLLTTDRNTSSTGQQDCSSSVCLLTLRPLTCDHLPRLFPVKPGSKWGPGQVWFTPCSVFIINLNLWQRYNGTHVETHVHLQQHMFPCSGLSKIS